MSILPMNIAARCRQDATTTLKTTRITLWGHRRCRPLRSRCEGCSEDGTSDIRSLNSAGDWLLMEMERGPPQQVELMFCARWYRCRVYCSTSRNRFQLQTGRSIFARRQSETSDRRSQPLLTVVDRWQRRAMCTVGGRRWVQFVFFGMLSLAIIRTSTGARLLLRHQLLRQRLA